MGSVERVLVVGILVVVVAILGIASLNADGSTNVPPDAAIDGGDGVGRTPLDPARSTVPPAAPDNATPPALNQVEQRRAQQAERQARRDEALTDLTGHPPVTIPPAVGTELAQAGEPQSIPVPRAAAPGTAPALDGFGPADGSGPGVEAPTAGAGVVPTQRARPALSRNGHPEPGQEDGGEASTAAPAKTPPPAKPVPRDVMYVVQEGDTIWQIVRKNYGEGDIQRQFDLVLEANPLIDPDYIEVGQKLKLPAVLPKDVITPSPLQKAEEGDFDLYEVVEGDTLSGIAAVQLGDQERWLEIYELNRKRIPDPNRMQVGTTLLLPKL